MFALDLGKNDGNKSQKCRNLLMIVYVFTPAAIFNWIGVKLIINKIESQVSTSNSFFLKIQDINPMDKKHLFVTVGTTKFDKLISTVTNENNLKLLRKLGYQSIQIQTGNKNYTKVSNKYIEITYSSFFEDFEEQIKRSDLIISHAGAGSCLEILQCGKPLIVVINEDLMNNHQIELAEHLSKQEHLYYCTCRTLYATLLKDFTILKPYPKVAVDTFGNYLNTVMGYPNAPKPR